MIDLNEHGTWAPIHEAATHYNVQPVTIYAWTYRRNIRSAPLDGHLHVNLDDIDAYRHKRVANTATHTVESMTSR